MAINNPDSGGVWEKIHDETLSVAGNFDVSGIAQSFVKLTGWLVGRSDVADTFDFMVTYFNGDTTAANYRRASLEGGTANVSAAADDSISGILTGATSPANYFGVVEFAIPLYAGSHEKFISCISGARRTAAVISTYQFHVQWEDTSPITQIAFQPDGVAEFVADSRLIIYGVT